MATSSSRKKISLSVVNALPPGTTAWDSDLKGFCARRQTSSTVTYMLKTRVAGSIRWFTIGRHGQPWTPESARRRAIDILSNPAIAEKSAPVVGQPFAVVAEHFLSKHGPTLKPRTLVEYRRMMDQYLVPQLGKYLVPEITRALISSAHAKWSKTPRSANFALTVMSKFMTWAEDEGHRPEGTNPVRRIQRFPEHKRQKFLVADELAVLGEALDQAVNVVGPYPVFCIRLLIYTGARLNEILTLEWAHVDFERRMIFLEDSKTGAKPVALNDAAIGVLKAIPRFEGNPYVIVGGRHGRHLINMQKPWQHIRRMAGMPKLRIHDLRHTFASVAVASGGSLPVIGRQLGHSQSQTTQRYAHLADDPVRQLTQATGVALSNALSGKQKKTFCSDG